MFIAAAVAFFIFAALRYSVPQWRALRPGGDAPHTAVSGDISAGTEGVRRSDDVPSVVSGEPGEALAFVALVMDDCGPSLSLADRVLALDLPITWAILPNQAHSAQIAKALIEKDVPFLVHVPMQALVDPDGKAGERGMYHIGVGMNKAAVTKALSRAIDSLPGAFGINNHRGSKATADPKIMEAVMDELVSRKLIFLDSNTSAKTIAYDTAKKKGLETFKNSHFLDNAADHEKIAHEMMFTIETAKKHGSAVAICHLRPETAVFLENLAEWDLPSKGVRLVTLPQLIDLESNSGGI